MYVVRNIPGGLREIREAMGRQQFRILYVKTSSLQKHSVTMSQKYNL